MGVTVSSRKAASCSPQVLTFVISETVGGKTTEQRMEILKFVLQQQRKSFLKIDYFVQLLSCINVEIIVV